MRQILASLVLTLALVAVGPANADEATAAKIVDAALAQTRMRVVYDPAYRVIPYPGGDVPADRGVCTDVVIRALRPVGLDLQKLVHEDMKTNFSAYPKHWGLKRPDRNIDHRRVPNLETYFTRAGLRLKLSRTSEFMPGDIVTWNLKGDAGYLPHIGVVTARRGRSGRLMVVHNIGAGPKHEDVLGEWKMTGHFRIAPHAARLGGG
jgi:uncharacterized protein YijF (DUF1287 family)